MLISNLSLLTMFSKDFFLKDIKAWYCFVNSEIVVCKAFKVKCTEQWRNKNVTGN